MLKAQTRKFIELRFTDNGILLSHKVFINLRFHEKGFFSAEIFICEEISHRALHPFETELNKLNTTNSNSNNFRFSGTMSGGILRIFFNYFSSR